MFAAHAIFQTAGGKPPYSVSYLVVAGGGGAGCHGGGGAGGYLTDTTLLSPTLS